MRTWVCSGTRAMVLCWSLHAQGQQCCSPWTLGACLAGSRLPWRHCPPARRCRMSCHGSRKPEPLPMHVCACLSRHHCRAFCSTGTATAPRAVPSTTPLPLFSSSLFLSRSLSSQYDSISSSVSPRAFRMRSASARIYKRGRNRHTVSITDVRRLHFLW